MKYFKPELLARCRSRDDDEAETAANEWDKATAAYRAHLKRIRSHLPAAATYLCANFSLHDAKLLRVAAHREQPAFGILLQLEGSSRRPGDLLDMHYKLVIGPTGGVQIKDHQRSKKSPNRNVVVLYDEFDLLEEDRQSFTHSLLLSDDQEIEVRFADLAVHQWEEVISPTELTERRWTFDPASI
jgi:hypothetical protein